MIRKETTRRIFSVVDEQLRLSFSGDYYKRCMYAATAIKALLERNGYSPVVVSGDFVSLVVSPDSQSARFQGYGGGNSDISHLWVECEDTILDLMTTYLPLDSDKDTAKVSPIAWRPIRTLPSAFTYDQKVQYAADFEFRGVEGIQEKTNTFIHECLRRLDQCSTINTSFDWILFDEKVLHARARRRDPWAMSLVKYETMLNKPGKEIFHQDQSKPIVVGKQRKTD